MPNISEVINQQKKKIKILRKISPLTPFLLTYLIGSNNFSTIRARLTKKTRTTKKVLNTMVDKNITKTKIFLQ